MASNSPSAWITIESSKAIQSPPRVAQRIPASIKLDQLQSSQQYTDPETLESSSRDGSHTLRTPADVESRPGTPPNHEVSIIQSLNNPSMNKWRFINACLLSLAQGMNDSAPGALLPYVERYYDIDYATVSFLFVGTSLGFIIAAPFTSILQKKLARAKMLVLSQIIGTIAYAIITARPPFPAVVFSFFLYGLAAAWSLALNNVFCALLTNATTLLGIFHGSYGIGGIIAPLIATFMINSGAVWSDFYAILLGLGVINGVTAFFVNHKFEVETETLLLTTTTNTSSRSENATGLIKAIQNRATILGAFFIFAYQGAEVSLSGWILSFLLTNRSTSKSQSPSLGYVTSGFWGGITVGRFLLSHPAHRVGEKLAVTILTIGATGLQVVVWLVPDVIGASVAIALVGLLLGPIYACAVSIFSRLLKRNELTSGLAFVSAVGSSGGAIAPFVTGIISQRVGAWVVNPVAIGLFGAMIAAWLVLPKVTKRTD